MTRHVVTQAVVCSRCGSAGERVWVVRPSPRGLRFSESFRCEDCGDAYEADGPELPKEARRAFIDAEGAWSLLLRDLGPRRLEVLGALRNALGLMPADTLRLASAGRSVLDGALVEVEQLESVLAAAGAQLEKVRLPR
jgi:hypothetical protein